MNLLLDTHIFLWLMNGDEKLSQNAQQMIAHTCQKNQLVISAISIWEIAMLQSKGRISLSIPIQQWVDKAISLPMIKTIPIDTAICLESCHLPGSFHSDPADRMIVATARILNIPLMTCDQKIIDYGQMNYLKVI